MNKILLFCIWTVLISALGIVLLVSYWMLYPYKTVTFKQPFVVLNSPVKIGDNLLMLVNYCKYTTEIPTVTSHFVDGIAFDVPEKSVVAKKVGCGEMVISEPIPEHLPPGDYVLQRVYKYHPNPIRDIQVVTETGSFIVIK